MKSYLLIISFFLISFSVFAQNFDSLISEKEQLLSQENEILMLLFDGIEISNKHQKNEVKWKPNFFENKLFPSSDDSFSYTQLDTVFFYLENNRKKAVAIFATYMYDDYETNQVVSSHFAAPNISIATFWYDAEFKEWKIENFDKSYGTHGLWGEMQPISLKKIGFMNFALLFNFGFTQMGETYSWTTIYDISSSKKIKTIEIHFDNLGYSQNENDKIERNKKIEFDTKIIEQSTYYPLIIITETKDLIKKSIFEYDPMEGYTLKKTEE